MMSFNAWDRNQLNMFLLELIYIYTYMYMSISLRVDVLPIDSLYCLSKSEAIQV